MITTREPVYDLANFTETTQEIDLEQISEEAGRALLRVGGVQGTDVELEGAARDFGLHALALNLLAAYIHEIPGHRVSNAAEIPDIDVPLEEGKHPRRVMSAFAKRFGESSAEVELLRILGLFSSPADKNEIAAVRAAPPISDLTEHVQELSDAEWFQHIKKLRHLKLFVPESRHRPESLDTRPLVREHFGNQLKAEYPEAWREANNRLYEYYKASAKKYPDTLEEMAPLFAAVMHGCQAGKHQEAWSIYYSRIQQRSTTNYICSQLGAFGAGLAVMSNYFEKLWGKPANALETYSKATVLGNASFLRGLGRLSEAAQPMQVSLEMFIAQKEWEQSTIVTSNLSELYLTIGDVKGALAYAEQSVQLADRISDWQSYIISRQALANALNQADQLVKAKSVFNMQKKCKRKTSLNFHFLVQYKVFITAICC